MTPLRKTKEFHAGGRAWIGTMPLYGEVESLAAKLRTEEREYEAQRAEALLASLNGIRASGLTELVKEHGSNAADAVLALIGAKVSAYAAWKAAMLDLSSWRREHDKALLEAVCGMTAEDLGGLENDDARRLIDDVSRWVVWEVVADTAPKSFGTKSSVSAERAVPMLTATMVPTSSPHDWQSTRTDGNGSIGMDGRPSPTQSGSPSL